MAQMIRYKGQLYKRIDSKGQNSEIINYLELNLKAKKAVMPLISDKEAKKKSEKYIKSLENAIKEAKNSKIHEAKRALEDAVKNSTNPVDTSALKSAIQKLK